MRLSYARNQNGSTDVLDRNNYYPFGMNHLNPVMADALFGKSIFKIISSTEKDCKLQQWTMLGC